MHIQSIEWRNLFSYGNEIQKLELGDNGQLWQLSGRSGAGKSSIMCLPKLLFYGKTEGVKINDIANRINKNGWLRGTVVKGKDIYVIERTFMPTSVTVYKNGTKLDKAGKKNMDLVINQEIMDSMPYHIFSNVINLSLKNFKSFISMTPNDKRLIIDKIFSLEAVNAIHEMISKDMKDVGNLINTNKSQIFTIEESIKRSEMELQKLSEKKEEDNKSKIEELNAKLVEINNQLTTNNNNYTVYYQTYTSTAQKKDAIVKLKMESDNDLNNINRMINLYKADKCPTCGASFEGEMFDTLRTQLEDKRAEILQQQTIYNSNIQSYVDMLQKIQTGIDAINKNISTLNKFKTAALTQLSAIDKESKSADEHEAIKRIIENSKSQKEEMTKVVNDNSSTLEYLNILEQLYGSDGIKRDMMRNYLPTLNEEIKNALIGLSFPYSLEFDDNFDPHLEHLGQEISPDTLSEGEKGRVNITVICALIRMIKRKYPQINIISLDETLSSLDIETSTDVVKYLGEIAEELNINVFIVSHAALDESLFDKRIMITKNSGFSELKYV